MKLPDPGLNGEDFWQEMLRVISGIAPLEGVPGQTEAEALKHKLLEILQHKLQWDLAPETPILVLVAGGTNTGKSSLVNWMAGESLTAVSPLARGTRSPLVCGSNSGLLNLQQYTSGNSIQFAFLRNPSQLLEEPVETVMYFLASNQFPAGVLVVDSPDFDSTHRGNRDWAHRLLIAADAVILVVTPEKYNDAAVIDFLQEAENLNKEIAVVFNKNEGTEALKDFKSIWKNHRNHSLLVMPRYPADQEPPSNVSQETKMILSDWSENSTHVKQNAREGALREFLRVSQQFLNRLSEENQWISKVNESMEELTLDVLKYYRQEIKKERFTEIDVVFRKLLEEYKIWLIDDFYNSIRKGSAQVVKTFRKVILRSDVSRDLDESMKRRERERLRAETAVTMIRSQLLKLPEKVPEVIRKKTADWISQWHRNCPEPDYNQYLDNMDRQVAEWINHEKEEISKKVSKHPNLRRFLIACKASVQLGFGVIGAYLTGGFNLYDVAWGPILERFMAMLLEAGLGGHYFLLRRADVMELRANLLQMFLDEIALNPIKANIPDTSGNQMKVLTTLLETFSGMEVD